ncbi:hypothetical protein MBELCI_1426 [Limimaricola cinnabarinus LL-001]|uniref:Uncharacterized protein n=1 Tax=Limimaricola cinnabarinus LL-001 TaxID=1337093 RepID=U3ACJ8_9RHOB|nr:hypothetical protein MBELCI_1426 [Limimaricola cinnabarinus LL-001]
MIDDRLHRGVEPMGEVDGLAAGEGAVIGAVVQVAGKRKDAPKECFKITVLRHALGCLAVDEVG